MTSNIPYRLEITKNSNENIDRVYLSHNDDAYSNSEGGTRLSSVTIAWLLLSMLSMMWLLAYVALCM